MHNIYIYIAGGVLELILPRTEERLENAWRIKANGGKGAGKSLINYPQYE